MWVIRASFGEKVKRGESRTNTAVILEMHPVPHPDCESLCALPTEQWSNRRTYTKVRTPAVPIRSDHVFTTAATAGRWKRIRRACEQPYVFDLLGISDQALINDQLISPWCGRGPQTCVHFYGACPLFSCFAENEGAEWALSNWKLRKWHFAKLLADKQDKRNGVTGH